MNTRRSQLQGFEVLAQARRRRCYFTEMSQGRHDLQLCAEPESVAEGAKERGAVSAPLKEGLPEPAGLLWPVRPGFRSLQFLRASGDGSSMHVRHFGIYHLGQ